MRESKRKSGDVQKKSGGKHRWWPLSGASKVAIGRCLLLGLLPGSVLVIETMPPQKLPAGPKPLETKPIVMQPGKQAAPDLLVPVSPERGLVFRDPAIHSLKSTTSPAMAVLPTAREEGEAFFAAQADPPPILVTQSSQPAPAKVSVIDAAIISPAPSLPSEVAKIAAESVTDLERSEAAPFPGEEPFPLGLETTPGTDAAILAEEVVPTLPAFDLAGGASAEIQPSTPLSSIGMEAISRDQEGGVDQMPSPIPSVSAASATPHAAAPLAQLQTRQIENLQDGDGQEQQVEPTSPAVPPRFAHSPVSGTAPAPGETMHAEAPRLATSPESVPATIVPALKVESRLPIMIDEQVAGMLEFQQTLDGLYVRVGSLVNLLSDRFTASELARMENASALDAYLSLADLRRAGIPISYDPIHDGFELHEPTPAEETTFTLGATGAAAITSGLGPPSASPSAEAFDATANPAQDPGELTDLVREQELQRPVQDEALVTTFALAAERPLSLDETTIEVPAAIPAAIPADVRSHGRVALAEDTNASLESVQKETNAVVAATDFGGASLQVTSPERAASEADLVPQRLDGEQQPVASPAVTQDPLLPVTESGSGSLQKPELSRVTERSAVLSVPLLFEGAGLGNVQAEITPTRVLSVSAADIAKVLGSLVNDATREWLLPLGSDLVPVDRLREIGLVITFLPSTLSLSVDIPLASRGRRVFSGSRQIDYSGIPVALPSDFSAGLSFSSFTTGDIVAMERVSSSLLVNGFTNVGGSDGVSILFGGQFDFTGSEKLFVRDRIIAFKDDTNNVLRYSAGDIQPLQSRYGGDFDLLGIGVQRFYQDLQPDRNVRPLGSRSFLLERPSLIEIYVNGALLRTFSAGPGPIDIRDIPAADLSNQVTIVIEDALGRREVDSFTLGNDINLLGEGLNEFSLNAGLLRDNRVVGFSYTSEPVASLFYRQGISESLTLSGSAIISENYQNIGLSAAFAALRGVTQIDVAASSSNVGEGAVVALTYRGSPIDLGFGGAQTNLRAEYRTPRFQSLASFGFLEDIEFDLAADVRANISPTMQAIVGATYFSTHRNNEERYGLFGGLQKQLGRFNLGVNLRYSEFNSRREFGALVTAAMRLGRRSNIFATVDTVSQTARVEYRQLRPLTLPEIDYGARAQYGPNSYEVGGRFGYGTSRFEALVDIQQEYDSTTSEFRNQSSVRLQTGIGFANGTFGIGRDPSRGFIMVKKHPSLENAQVRVSTGAVGRDLGFANSAGPAVVPVFIPYRAQEIRVSTENAPMGYNIGAGEYVAMPGARTGIAITVGSEEYRIATATLTGFDSKVLGLTTGRLINLETGKALAFFTNRVGRAVFTQLVPGRYRAEIDGTDLQFEFEVREDDPANISLGNIELRSGK